MSGDKSLEVADGGAIADVFGDGTHPTTRLAVTAITEVLARRRAARVLDVGTGTGVLVRAALAAGADLAIGIDHSEAAIDMARTMTGGASAFRVVDARDYLTQMAGGAFDVVVANLPDPPLESLCADLAAAVRPTGTVIVTGMLLWQTDAIAGALKEAGMRVVAQRAEAGWALLVADC